MRIPSLVCLISDTLIRKQIRFSDSFKDISVEVSLGGLKVAVFQSDNLGALLSAVEVCVVVTGGWRKSVYSSLLLDIKGL